MVIITEKQIEDFARVTELRHEKERNALKTVLEMIHREGGSIAIGLEAVAALPKEKRVRGIRAAVSRILPELPEVFDRQDVSRKLEDTDPDLAKRVTQAGLRDTLRLLSKHDEIVLVHEATNTKPARYRIKKAA